MVRLERNHPAERNVVYESPKGCRPWGKPPLIRYDSFDLFFVESSFEPFDGLLITVLQDTGNRILRKGSGIERFGAYVPKQIT